MTHKSDPVGRNHILILRWKFWFLLLMFALTLLFLLITNGPGLRGKAMTSISSGGTDPGAGPLTNRNPQTLRDHGDTRTGEKPPSRDTSDCGYYYDDGQILSIVVCKQQ